MVFKPFSHLTRQSFAKSIAHGYAQPFVAASQSSCVATPFGSLGNHTSSRSSKPGSLQFHNAFQQNTIASAAGTSSKPAPSSSNTSSDGGLAAYYAAWQQHRNGEEESPWKQFQFPKRLGWRAPAVSREAKGKDKVVKEDDTVDKTTARPAPELIRRHSAGEVLERLLVQDVSQQDASTPIPKELERSEPKSPASVSVSQQQPSSAEEESPLHSDHEIYSTKSATPPSSTSVQSTAATSLPEESYQSGSQSFLDRLSELSDAQQYGEIPVVFESMLAAGIKPTPAAYDSLLAAAIHLPISKHLVVPKALDVYFDLLKRGIKPTANTVATILNLLAIRATDALQMIESLNQRRTRLGGMHVLGQALFRSNEAELGLLKEDNSIDLAIRIFAALPSSAQTLSTRSFDLLISACAKYGRIDDMLRFQAFMEQFGVTPSGFTFESMIEAFGVTGDLSSAVECFNEYKAVAIANDAGAQNIIFRSDRSVYAALLRAYATNGKMKGALRVYSKVEESLRQASAEETQIEDLRNDLIPRALIRSELENGSYSGALQQTMDADIAPSVKSELFQVICVKAADAGNLETATAAFNHGTLNATEPSIALLALNLRLGRVEDAEQYWNIISNNVSHPQLVDATTLYALAHLAQGNVDHALGEARRVFAQMRSLQSDFKSTVAIREDIDEALEVFGRFLVERKIVLPPIASINAICAVAENEGTFSHLTEHALMSLGPEAVDALSSSDLAMVLQLQAQHISSGLNAEAGYARFAYMLRAAIGRGILFNQEAAAKIDQALSKASFDEAAVNYFDLIRHWQVYVKSASENSSQQQHAFLSSHSGPVMPSPYERADDPYLKTTDIKGSTSITDDLEKNNGKSGSARLNEALSKFKNIRRAGRHPRYVTYAKLISAAAREGRSGLVYELLAMAQADIPLMPQYEVVRHGWSLILDAMVGSSLTLGDRTAAERYHQELLNLGAAPTANTFGLYITTLKASTKTFDEASEAVKIFQRARSEGVEPTSFLYNALIGKLGKARRIDDCLLYFTEMRARGIRPTSVTYGTIVNALCRVSDEKFAEEIFEEMESMPNYKPRPAPYNSLMQFLLNTKRDRSKVLAYYERMRSRNIEPTMHTYKLLIDSHAMLEPVDMAAAEGVLDQIYSSGQIPEAVHFASLIHAKGCVQHDMQGALKVFQDVMRDGVVQPHSCLYQALFEAMVANHAVKDTHSFLEDMRARNVKLTAYIANTLIHGWALENNVDKAKEIYDVLGRENREPSTYDAMTRAFLTSGDKPGALKVAKEMMTRGYPSAVAGKIIELIGGRTAMA